jgi:hypothetical protein
MKAKPVIQIVFVRGEYGARKVWHEMKMNKKKKHILTKKAIMNMIV